MRLTTAVLTIAAVCGAATTALAGPASLREVLEFQDERRPAPPPVAHYVSGDGAAFVLDRTGNLPLLKFEQSSEIWVLFPSAAPRGDVVYRNDIGDLMLRATKLGGLTLFSDQRPSGAPVALTGDADILRLSSPTSASGLLQRLAQASARASRAAQRLIPFEAKGVTPGSEPVFADAAAVTADAIVRMSRGGEARNMLGRVTKVRLTPGRKPGVDVRGGVMQLMVVPQLGVAGRPSSERVINAAESIER